MKRSPSGAIASALRPTTSYAATTSPSVMRRSAARPARRRRRAIRSRAVGRRAARMRRARASSPRRPSPRRGRAARTAGPDQRAGRDLAQFDVAAERYAASPLVERATARRAARHLRAGESRVRRQAAELLKRRMPKVPAPSMRVTLAAINVPPSAANITPARVADASSCRAALAAAQIDDVNEPRRRFERAARGLRREPSAVRRERERRHGAANPAAIELQRLTAPVELVDSTPPTRPSATRPVEEIASAYANCPVEYGAGSIRTRRPSLAS